jgi:hypothetical protein
MSESVAPPNVILLKLNFGMRCNNVASAPNSTPRFRKSSIDLPRRPSLIKSYIETFVEQSFDDFPILSGIESLKTL